MNWTKLSVVAQCQTDDYSLSSKDGDVAWQYFRQFADSCLTILEMTVDYCRNPHSLIYFRAISVDFNMWFLCFPILIELGLRPLSGDHTISHPFNEVAFLGIVRVCSWWKVGCPRVADQFGINLCWGHGYLEANGSGWAMPPLHFARVHIKLCSSVKFMQGICAGL